MGRCRNKEPARKTATRSKTPAGDGYDTVRRRKDREIKATSALRALLEETAEKYATEGRRQSSTNRWRDRVQGPRRRDRVDGPRQMDGVLERRKNVSAGCRLGSEPRLQFRERRHPHRRRRRRRRDRSSSSTGGRLPESSISPPSSIPPRRFAAARATANRVRVRGGTADGVEEGADATMKTKTLSRYRPAKKEESKKGPRDVRWGFWCRFERESLKDDRESRISRTPQSFVAPRSLFELGLSSLLSRPPSCLRDPAVVEPTSLAPEHDPSRARSPPRTEAGLCDSTARSTSRSPSRDLPLRQLLPPPPPSVPAPSPSTDASRFRRSLPPLPTPSALPRRDDGSVQKDHARHGKPAGIYEWYLRNSRSHEESFGAWKKRVDDWETRLKRVKEARELALRNTRQTRAGQAEGRETKDGEEKRWTGSKKSATPSAADCEQSASSIPVPLSLSGYSDDELDELEALDSLDEIDAGTKAASFRARLERDLARSARLSERLARSTRLPESAARSSTREVAPRESPTFFLEEHDRQQLASMEARIRDTIELIEKLETATKRSEDRPPERTDAGKAREKAPLLESDEAMSERVAFERELKEKELQARGAQRRGAKEGQKPRPSEAKPPCKHYVRNCLVSFGGCCGRDYVFGCHRCHNEESSPCKEQKVMARDATHLKCQTCGSRQEIDAGGAQCRKCGTPTAAYFCAICKHFTSTMCDPYHCDKCGVCRVHRARSFHCDTCGVCFDKRLEGNHKCRPDRKDDVCGVCMEGVFSGCHLLGCGHGLHRDCIQRLIAFGRFDKCPICRQPTTSPLDHPAARRT